MTMQPPRFLLFLRDFLLFLRRLLPPLVVAASSAGGVSLPCSGISGVVASSGDGVAGGVGS